uniref:Helix-turn-helix domain protein n=1 Tax=Siphoviridae sp. ctGdK3 TaxID=2826222 RepID=A0A8S5MU44_9CAUD|nr:MAG TPA: helix-turn-helix domain protein [Siphoviridae sp. ctGdK3]
MEIAKKAGISWRAYQTYEAGDRIPKADTAKLIAKALGSTVEELF